MRLCRANKRMDECARKLVVGELCQVCSAGIVNLWCHLARSRNRLNLLPVFIGLRFLRAIYIAARVAEDVLHHELGFYSPLPALSHGLKHQIDH